MQRDVWLLKWHQSLPQDEGNKREKADNQSCYNVSTLPSLLIAISMMLKEEELEILTIKAASPREAKDHEGDPARKQSKSHIIKALQ